MANPLAPVTLTADTVETFTLDGDYSQAEISRAAPGTAGTDEIYASFDGIDPTVDGAGFLLIQASVATIVRDVSGAGATIVKLISHGTPKVQVGGLTRQ